MSTYTTPPDLPKRDAVITGEQALNLPRGSAIERVFGPNGNPVRASSALVKTYGKRYICPTDPTGRRPIAPDHRYRVLMIGRPEDPQPGGRR